MRFLTAHPHEVGETYAQHFRVAARFGASMVIGGLACLLHACVPCVCTTSGSRRVRALHNQMTGRSAPAGYGTFAWDI